MPQAAEQPLSQLGRARPRKWTSPWLIPVELGVALAQGAVLLSILYGLARLGWVGTVIRLCVSFSVLFTAVISGAVTKFVQHKFAPCFQPFDVATNRLIWGAFVWGKYLAVAFLELTTCLARTLHPSMPHWLVLGLTTGLLAFNIGECVLVEARAAVLLKDAHVAAGAWLNVATGAMLTVITLGQPTALTVDETAFHYNHSPMFVLAYALWNIKFASVLQDNATIWHVCHSHIWSLISAAVCGTDYMDYRVACLHVHFSAAVCFSTKQPAVQKSIGYASFYDCVMGPRWMWSVSVLAAVCTMTCVAQLCQIDDELAHRAHRAAAELVM